MESNLSFYLALNFAHSFFCQQEVNTKSPDSLHKGLFHIPKRLFQLRTPLAWAGNKLDLVKRKTLIDGRFLSNIMKKLETKQKYKTSKARGNKILCTKL